jgi:hypothetical protein
MTYSAESIAVFWALMRAGRPKPFLVRRLLQRLDRGEIDERAATEWLADTGRAGKPRRSMPSLTVL